MGRTLKIAGQRTLTYEQVAATLAETERKARRCSDCSHWVDGSYGKAIERDCLCCGQYGCALGRWPCGGDTRANFRIAANCDDFVPAPEDQG